MLVLRLECTCIGRSGSWRILPSYGGTREFVFIIHVPRAKRSHIGGMQAYILFGREERGKGPTNICLFSLRITCYLQHDEIALVAERATNISNKRCCRGVSTIKRWSSWVLSESRMRKQMQRVVSIEAGTTTMDARKGRSAHGQSGKGAKRPTKNCC